MKKLIPDIDYILDEKTGKIIFTREYLLSRQFCCNSKCKNCPYKEINSMDPKDLEEIKKAIREYFYHKYSHKELGYINRIDSWSKKDQQDIKWSFERKEYHIFPWKTEALMSNARNVIEKYFIKYSNDFTNELLSEIRSYFKKIDLMRYENSKKYASNRRDYVPTKIDAKIKILHNEILELKEKIEKSL